MSVKVRIEAEVRATEDEGKVAEAISNLTGSREFSTVQRGNIKLIVQEGDESLLVQLRRLLRRERILDAARKIMISGTRGSQTVFFLNKQVAYSGHVSFCMPEGESPLGPIKFTVESSDPKSFIDWIATKTVDGRPIDEICQSESRRSAHSERPSRR